jgi:hypothetical protein
MDNVQITRPLVTLHPPIDVDLAATILAACAGFDPAVVVDTDDDGDLHVMLTEYVSGDDPRARIFAPVPPRERPAAFDAFDTGARMERQDGVT